MRRALLALTILGCWGCTSPVPESASTSGSTNAAGATGSTGGNTTGGGSSGSTGSGTTTSSTTTSSGGSSGTTSAAEQYAGYILFNDISFGTIGVPDRHAVTAAFTTADAGAILDPAACSGGTLDNNGCCYRDAATTGGTSGGGDAGSAMDAGPAPDAGTTGGATPAAGVIDLTANGTNIGQMQPANNLYPPYALATWSAGQQLGAQAAGDVVHAFTGAVGAPTSAAITSPTVGGLTAAPVSTSSALVVTWTGAGQKAVVILSDVTFTKTLTCYGDNNGQRTISSTTLSQYFASSAGQYGFLLVGVANVATATADNATLTIAADTAVGGAIQFQ